MLDFFYKEKGTGYPIVLLHGFCETHSIWDDFREKLSDEFRVITPDLPGFGNSPLPHKPFLLADIASGLYHFIKEELRLNNCIVIGHSLGGYITLEIERKYYEILDGFCLFNSTAFEDAPEKKSNRNKLIEFIDREGVPPFIKTFVPSLFNPNRADEFESIIHAIHNQALKTDPEAVKAYAAAMRDRPDSTDLLRSSARRAFLISGELDSSVTLEASISMQKLLPKNRVHILPDTAHMAMFEQKDLSLELIRGFVNEMAAK